MNESATRQRREVRRPAKSIKFVAYGKPQQRGSKRAVLIPKRSGGFVMKNGRPLTAAKDDNENSKAWMAIVNQAAAEAYQGDLIRGAASLSVVFYFGRPQSHYGTGRNAGTVKASAPVYHTNQPDLSKLVRCLEDALSGVVWDDDRLVCHYVDIRKEWTTGRPRAEVEVREI